MVAFKIIDIFLRLGFVLVLMPLFVATWAFPVSRDFCKKGLMFFLAIVTEFLGLALAINFIMMAFEAGIATDKQALLDAMAAPNSKDYGTNLYNVIISGGGWYFLFMLTALFLMGTQLLAICTKMVSSLFGTETEAITGLGGDLTGAVAASMVKMTGNLGKKAWGSASTAAENADSHVDKSLSYEAGRAAGRMASEKKEEKSSSAAAPKRYFGERAGNGVKNVMNSVANGLDKVGVSLGQGLQKTGIGAVVGVPLTLATKTLTTGLRAAGSITSGIVKTPGAVVHGVRHAGETFKNIGKGIKNSAKAVGSKLIAGPKSVYDNFKKGFSDGKK